MVKKIGVKKLSRGRPVKHKHHLSNKSLSCEKQKKIAKAPKVKDTVLSDIELQIVDLFSRNYTNGEIGVKFPQQKKKGMMRLMSSCFRTILDEVQLNVNSALKKQAHTSKGVDRRQKTIFHLSSNYREKHLDPSLLDQFKLVCRNYFKYRSFEHMEPKFLETFYKKVIHNDFNTAAIKAYHQVESLILPEDHLEPVLPKKRGRKKGSKNMKKRGPKPTPKRTYTKASERQAALNQSASAQEQPYQFQTPNNDHLEKISIQPNDPQTKSNKICIEKINIYFGYDKDGKIRKNQEIIDPFLRQHQYACIDDDDYKPSKKIWTQDMQAQLIQQFSSQNGNQINVVIRNLMRKFGRNKLFVEDQIYQKKKEMFEICVKKFIKAFEGINFCTKDQVHQMQLTLRKMNLNHHNFFVARFIQDFYFKKTEAISVTVLSQYLHKLSCNDIKKGIQHQSLKTRYIPNERQGLKKTIDSLIKCLNEYDSRFQGV